MTAQESLMFICGAIFGATCVSAVFMGAHVWRIVRNHRQRRRSRTFDVPKETTLLDVILREVDVYREKRALRIRLERGEPQ